jgi:hypothetical protein
VLVLAAAAWSLVALPDPVVRDSDEFTEALRLWHPLVVRGQSPRGVKRFHNRVRYYAMRQREAEPPRSRWRRLLRWIVRQWRQARALARPERPADAGTGALGHEAPTLRVVDGADDPPAPAAAPAAAPDTDHIPDDRLVALAALHDCVPAALEDPAFLSRPAEWLDRSLEPALREALAPAIGTLRGQIQIDRWVRRFRLLAAGVRVQGSGWDGASDGADETPPPAPPSGTPAPTAPLAPA